MEKLGTGKHFGISKKQFGLDGLIIVDSEFNHFQSCPWHYHENAHFAFTTSGNLVETHRHEKLQLSKGSLMYNHTQEPHFNSHYSEKVSALHIDIDKKWFAKHSLKQHEFEGLHMLNDDPAIKSIFLKINNEVKQFDNASPIAIEGLLLQAFAQMQRKGNKKKHTIPAWVLKAKEMLNDRFAEKLTLEMMSSGLGIHPVYLSQQFPLYFGSTFGEFIRGRRIEKAISLMSDPSLTLTQIAYMTGFSDQSHFTRSFRQATGCGPAAYRKMNTRS